MIRQYRLDYNPQDSYAHWSDRLKKNVWLPGGIVIPWELDGTIWCVNFRRNDEEKRYIQAAGGTKTLYMRGKISANDAVLLVEGEFDALS